MATRKNKMRKISIEFMEYGEIVCRDLNFRLQSLKWSKTRLALCRPNIC